MAKSKIPYESLSISGQNRGKRKKIQRLFRDLPAERKHICGRPDLSICRYAPSLSSASSRRINAGDLTERFKQGAQQLRRETRPSRATIRQSSRLPPSRKASSTSSRENSETGRRGAYEFRHEARGSW